MLWLYERTSIGPLRTHPEARLVAAERANEDTQCSHVPARVGDAR